MYVAVINLRVGRLNISAGQKLDGLPPDIIKMLVREGSARLEESAGDEIAPAPVAPAQKPAKNRSLTAADYREHSDSTEESADDATEELPEPSEAERQNIINNVLSAAYDGV